MSQELAANRFLMEKLNAIEARLDSIERMLGAESKPEQIKTVDLSRCRENLRLSGKPYARSNCDLCGSLLNPGRKCLRDSDEQLQQPEWKTGSPPENKMVIIRTRRDNNYFGYLTKQGFYNIFLIDGSVVNEVTRPSFLFEQWREMNIEESAYAWENRILGADAEHAELSTLELPIANQEPERRLGIKI